MLSAVALLAIVVAVTYLEPIVSFYGPNFLRLRLGWVLPVYLTLLAGFSRASIGTKANRKTRSFVRTCRLRLRSVGGEPNTEETKSTSYLGEAAPLTDDERYYERSQFRPYEVLRHMSRDARENLIEDARTQTLEMWKSHHPSDYDVLRTNDKIKLEKFEVEVLPDDQERLHLKVVPTLSTSGDSSEIESETYEIVSDFCHAFQDRVVEIAILHDEFESNELE